jgi:hypothetical protein
VEEIVEGIGISTKTQDLGRTILMAVALVGWDSTLDDMAKAGLIDKKTVNSENYYRIHKK